MEGKGICIIMGCPNIIPARFITRRRNNPYVHSPPRTSCSTPKPPTKTSSSKPKKRPSVRDDAALRDIHRSSHFIPVLDRLRGVLKVADLNIILRNFGRSNRWKDVSQLFDWMRKNGKVNFASYSSYIKFMTESRDFQRALNAYETISDEAMKKNISICNSILSCLVKNNNFEKATFMFQEMKQRGLQPDIITYSTLLAGCLKVKDSYAKAMELVGELDNKGIQMDSVTYGTLIAVCASNFKCEEAELYFKRMKTEGHTPNMHHYSSLLNAYSINGHYEKADKLIQDMKSAGLEPNKVVMTTLLKVYVKGRLFDQSRLLLSELEALGYAEDEMPYCQLMDGFSKSGQVGEAKMVFDQMNKREVKSDGYSHSIMISAFCRAGQLEEAKKLACDYEAMYNKYDLVILNVMLCAYCRSGDMENVMQIMRKMDTLAINPDQKTFHILIKYFVKEKLYMLAYRTLLDMHNKGHQMEEEVLSSLLLHLGRAGSYSETLSVYNILRTSHNVKDRSLHENVLQILMEGKFLEEAYMVFKENAKIISRQAVETFLTEFMKFGNVNLISDVLETMRVSGHKIHQDMLRLAISCYIAQPEKTEELLQLLQWISRQGYSIDSSTRNLILENSNVTEQHSLAEFLYKV